jgi:hypothetical protein
MTNDLAALSTKSGESHLIDTLPPVPPAARTTSISPTHYQISEVRPAFNSHPRDEPRRKA